MEKFLVASGLTDKILLFVFGFSKADVLVPGGSARSKRFNMSTEEINLKLDSWISSRDKRYNDFTLSELSQKVSIPERYLRLHFRSEFDMDFRQWRTKLRTEEAMELMRRSPERTIVSISRELGFESTSSFHRQFRRATGCSPKEWMKINC